MFTASCAKYVDAQRLRQRERKFVRVKRLQTADCIQGFPLVDLPWDAFLDVSVKKKKKKNFGRSIIVADINIISMESMPKADYVIYKAKLSRIKSLQSRKHSSGNSYWFCLIFYSHIEACHLSTVTLCEEYVRIIIPRKVLLIYQISLPSKKIIHT